jgi:hypothetical protein
MNTPSPSRWSDLFDVAISIIEQANRDVTIIDRWTLGGGTALMLQIDHRESHDIDVFVDDPQLMPFLNPETQDFMLSLRPSSYTTDGTQSLKIVFDGVGEIDVICCGWLTEDYAAPAKINGAQIQLESPREIIAKKVYHRGWNLQPRDMFDIAAVRQVYGDDYIISALSAFPDDVALAQNIAEQMNPGLAQGVLSGLAVRADFFDLIKTAQASVIELLSRVPR